MSYTKTTSRLLLSISVLALAACGGGPTRSVDTHKTAAPMPPVASNESADKAIPVSDTLSPVDTVAAPTTNVVSDSSMEARMAKLENAVGSLRTDYDRIMPAFASLNSTNERIQTLLDQIENESGKPVAASAVTAAAPVSQTVTTTTKVSTPPVMEPEKGLKIQETKVVEETTKVSHATDAAERVTPTAQTVVKATPIEMKVNPDGTPVKKTTTTTTTTATTTTALTPEEATKMAIAQTGGQSVASNVRIGEHPGKTRLVLDLSKDTKPDFKTDLDNGEKLLTVELPGVTWGGSTTGTPKSSAFIAGWNANKTEGGGSTLGIQLKKDAKILSTQYLKPEKGDPARLVIDIGPAT